MPSHIAYFVSSRLPFFSLAAPFWFLFSFFPFNFFLLYSVSSVSSAPSALNSSFFNFATLNIQLPFHFLFSNFHFPLSPLSARHAAALPIPGSAGPPFPASARPALQSFQVAVRVR